jgi:hypothetical protein
VDKEKTVQHAKDKNGLWSFLRRGAALLDKDSVKELKEYGTGNDAAKNPGSSPENTDKKGQ